MRRDPQFLKALREATQNAAHDLESLKLSKAETGGGIGSLRQELRSLVIKTHTRFVNNARSIVCRAKESSARHRRELIEIKKTAHEAATRLRNRKDRQRNLKTT